MSETINDRIEMLMNKHFDGNRAAFAKSLGLSPTGLGNYIGTQRRSKPSVDMVAKIVTTMNVDARWLLTGEGEANVNIKTEGDFSPASQKGNVEVIVGNSVLAEKVKSLNAMLQEKEARLNEKEERIKEKDARIAEKEERISELKEQIKELKG